MQDAVAGTDQAIGVIARVPVAGGEFERSILAVDQVRIDGEPWQAVEAKVVVYLPEHGEGVSLDDRVFVVWQVTGVPELSPGYATYVRSQGATASAWVYAYSIQAQGPAFFHEVAGIRRDISGNLASAFPGDAGALASGIVTGDDSGMSDDAMEAFRATGTAHVTAVSGQNISLLIGFLSLWLRPTGRRSRVVSHGLMIVAVWLFALMVGLEPPALRASIVATMTILGAWSGRRPDPVTLLALSLGVMAFISPSMTSSIGFWLSAAASWALCSVVPVEAPSGLAGKLTGLLMGPLAASLATLPVLVWTFHEWSPIAPVANAVLTPIMTVLFPLTYLFAVLSFLPTPIADVVAWVPGIGLDLALSIVDRLSRIAPQVHLDADGAQAAVMIAVPALLVLVAWSRDGQRWMRLGSWRG
jgi:competence protein ComEC